MPRVKAKILNTWVDEKGHKLAVAQFNQRTPKKGDFVDVHWGAKRSNSQNAFMWLYLTFLWDDCNLKEEYLTIEELHETLKATFLSKKITNASGIEIIKVGSTAVLDKVSFAEYLDKIDKAMVKFHSIDTSQFWLTYAKDYKI